MKIEITSLDKNLLADLDGQTDGWEAHHIGDYHVAFSPDAGRGGAVYVGSGSSGYTAWTDASSADEVADRFARDEMSN